VRVSRPGGSPHRLTGGQCRGHRRGAVPQPPNACLPSCLSSTTGQRRGHRRGAVPQPPNACLPSCLSSTTGQRRGRWRGAVPQPPNASTRKSDARWLSPTHQARIGRNSHRIGHAWWRGRLAPAPLASIASPTCASTTSVIVQTRSPSAAERTTNGCAFRPEGPEGALGNDTKKTNSVSQNH